MSHPRLLKRGSVYYFRARVPKDLVAAFGKSEVRYSLRTRDYHEACRLVRQASAEFDRECARRRGMVRQHAAPPRKETLDDDLIREICMAWQIASLEGDEQSRRQGLYADDQSLEAHKDEREETIGILRKAYSRGNIMETAQALHTFLSLFLHIDPVGKREDWDRLFSAFLATALETQKLLLKRDQGEVVHAPSGEGLRRLAPQAAIHARELTLDRLHEAWKRSDPDRSQAGFYSMGKALERFRAFVGHNDASRIRREDVVGFRDWLIEQGKKPATVGKDISFLCALFNVGIDNGWLDKNPAQRIRIPRDHGKASRLPFSQEDLKAMFLNPIYTRGASIGQKKYRDSFVWMPLIALYHGFRLEEIAQLQTEDVVRMNGLPCFRIDDYSENGESGKRLKTASSRRIIPVHPELIRLGFLVYVDRVRTGKSQWLFPELKPAPGRKRGDAFSRVYMRFLRNRIGIRDERKVFHSFRHTFRDACREAGLDEEISDALMGHSSRGKMGRHYGSGFSVRRLHEAISKITYPGLDIPVQIPEEDGDDL